MSAIPPPVPSEHGSKRNRKGRGAHRARPIGQPAEPKGRQAPRGPACL